MAKEAWNRWGAEDERGAINLIGSEQVRSAAGLVLRGEVHSLSQPISSAMSVPRHRPQFAHFMGRDGGDYSIDRQRPGGFQFAEDTIMMPLHAGTHLDALCHCWYDDTLYNGFAATGVRSSGAVRLGIDHCVPIATRGVLVNLVVLAGAPLEDGSAVGIEMISAALARTATTLRQGDAVLLRTGWFERQHAESAINFNAEPGLDLDAALFLAELGVSLVGADNYAIEQLPFPGAAVFPVHQRLIRDYGIPLLEGLVLKPLAERCSTSTFLFVAAPLPIVGATASPINPVAIL